MHPKDAGFDEYCLRHTRDTESKGSRYANTRGQYGPGISTDHVGD